MCLALFYALGIQQWIKQIKIPDSPRVSLLSVCFGVGTGVDNKQESKVCSMLNDGKGYG